jgi:hypothetical protein
VGVALVAVPGAVTVNADSLAGAGRHAGERHRAAEVALYSEDAGSRLVM